MNLVEVDLSNPAATILRIGAATNPALHDGAAAVSDPTPPGAATPTVAGDSAAAVGQLGAQLAQQLLGEEAAGGGPGGTPAGSQPGQAAAGDAGDDLNARRAYKLKFQEGVALFNRKPRKGEGPPGPPPRPLVAWVRGRG